MNFRFSTLAPVVLGVEILGGATLSVRAQPAPTTETVTSVAPGKASATQTTKAVALVVGIDSARRIIELRLHDGHIVETVAGPEIRNFDQIGIGDRVDVEYSRALALELKKAGSGIRQSTERVDMSRSPIGAKPAVSVRG